MDRCGGLVRYLPQQTNENGDVELQSMDRSKIQYVQIEMLAHVEIVPFFPLYM